MQPTLPVPSPPAFSLIIWMHNADVRQIFILCLTTALTVLSMADTFFPTPISRQACNPNSILSRGYQANLPVGKTAGEWRWPLPPKLRTRTASGYNFSFAYFYVVVGTSTSIVIFLVCGAVWSSRWLSKPQQSQPEEEHKMFLRKKGNHLNENTTINTTPQWEPQI